MPYTFANPTGQCEACFDWRELSSVTIYMLARLTYSYWGGDYRYCSGALVDVVHPLLLVAMPCMVCTSECYVRSLCPAHLQSSCSNVETMQWHLFSLLWANRLAWFPCPQLWFRRNLSSPLPLCLWIRRHPLLYDKWEATDRRRLYRYIIILSHTLSSKKSFQIVLVWLHR